LFFSNDSCQKYEIDKRKKICKHIYGNEFPNCKSFPPTSSYGLLADASVVCNTLKDFSETPYFYFEKFSEDYDKKGMFFPNLDETDFSAMRKDSPKIFLCKTKQTYDILKREFPEKTVLLTGFTSLDKYDPTIRKDYSKFLHIVGQSPFKGSEMVIKTWIKHPEWPQLTVITHGDIGNKLQQLVKNPVNNIKLIVDFLSDKELIEISNRIGIHICASSHEGFGHYIHEAKAVKAVILYTNAPSMNETFVDGISGIGIDCTYSGIVNRGFCPSYEITEKGLEQAVLRVVNMSKPDLENIGENARLSYLDETSKFETTLRNIVKKNIYGNK
jgi:glycosyltransferase involved in cell wall biosynthesis